MMTLTAIAKDYSQSMNRIKSEKELANLLKSLSKLEVLVGVPQETTDRKGEGGVTNAQLIMLHTKGSPLQNLPPRPIIEPALEQSETKQMITDGLKDILQALLNRDPSSAKKNMKILGQHSVNAVQNWFDDPRNSWTPDTEKTIIAKMKKKYKGKKKRKEATESALAGVQGINVTLVDTNQMRKAITYVIRED